MNKYDKVALITGGSRGLGRSMIEHLTRTGVGILFTYNSDESSAREVASSAAERGVDAIPIQLDTTDPRQYPAFLANTEDALKRVFERESIDYLVHNAGFGVHSSLMQTTEAQFDDLIQIHLKAPLLLTQRLSDKLGEDARILLVSTALTRVVFPGYGAYAAAKAGLEMLGIYLAQELGPRGIRVNVIAPGAIETDFGGGIVRDNPDINRMIAERTTLGRVGVPSDVGAAVAALLSSGTSWITGQRIEVSGGQQLSR